MQYHSGIIVESGPDHSIVALGKTFQMNAKEQVMIEGANVQLKTDWNMILRTSQEAILCLQSLLCLS